MRGKKVQLAPNRNRALIRWKKGTPMCPIKHKPYVFCTKSTRKHCNICRKPSSKMRIGIIFVIMTNKVKRQSDISGCLLALLYICLSGNALFAGLLAPFCIERSQYPPGRPKYIIGLHGRNGPNTCISECIGQLRNKLKISAQLFCSLYQNSVKLFRPCLKNRGNCSNQQEGNGGKVKERQE